MTGKQASADAQTLSSTIERATRTASLHHFTEVGIEHILHAAIDLPEMKHVILNSGGDPDMVRASLDEAFSDHADIVPRIDTDIRCSKAVNRMLSEIPEGGPNDFFVRSIISNTASSMVAEAAIRHGGADKLLADIEGASVFEEAIGYLDFPPADNGLLPGSQTHAPRNPQEHAHPRHGHEGGAAPEQKSGSRRSMSETVSTGLNSKRQDEADEAVSSSLRNMVEAARNGDLDPCIGRDREIDLILSAIKRRRKGSVLLYGEAGVGETAIAEGIALRLIGANADRALAERPFYELSMAAIVAGTKFRGDFEARIKRLIERLQAERAIVFIDEIHMLVGSGSTYGRGMDGANLLKPALARGDITVIGATTTQEMRLMRQDAALMRRFEPVSVREPTRSETEEILENASWTYLVHHELSLGEDVIAEICRICDLYQPERRFPDKAFDLLDAACVMAREVHSIPRVPLGEPVLEKIHVHGAVRRLGIRRPERLDPGLAERLKRVRRALSEDIIGQEDALSDIVSAALSATSMLKTEGPRAGIIIRGPASCGKSHMVERFAAHMGLPLVRIDMRSSRARGGAQYLIGASGISGLDKPGLLVEAGDSHMDCVILVDDLDKADEQSIEIIQDAVRKGVVRSADGRSVSLRGAYMFMTLSGSGHDTSRKIGFVGNGSGQEPDLETLLPRDLIDAADRIIETRSLDQNDLEEIIATTMRRIASRSPEIGVELEFDPAMFRVIARRCQNGREAARAARQGVEDALASILASEETQGVYRLSCGSGGNVEAEILDG